MIPHHSIAILTSKNANITDPGLGQKLCQFTRIRIRPPGSAEEQKS